MHQLRVVEALNLIIKFDIILHNHKKRIIYQPQKVLTSFFEPQPFLTFITKCLSNVNSWDLIQNIRWLTLKIFEIYQWYVILKGLYVIRFDKCLPFNFRFNNTNISFKFLVSFHTNTSHQFIKKLHTQNTSQLI